MVLDWFDSSKAAELGTALAEELAPRATAESASGQLASDSKKFSDAVNEMLLRADRETRDLRLNFYKRAKVANSFKWKLLEKGVDRQIADDVTQLLVMRLSTARDTTTPVSGPQMEGSASTAVASARVLMERGNQCMKQGAFEEAIGFYEELLRKDPRNALALNNIGAALVKLGTYDRAEKCFRDAVKFAPNLADAYSNLGSILRASGRVAEAELWLRQAIKLNPTLTDGRNNLGLTLAFLGRLNEAKTHFKKVLKRAARNPDAMFGLGHIAAMEGQFGEAESMMRQAIGAAPDMPSAWAALAELRKMKRSDNDWLRGAEKLAASGLAPLDEATMRFSIGKYYDDVEEFEQAFRNFDRGNLLLKAIARPYDHSAHKNFVNDMKNVFTREYLGQKLDGASQSRMPVFVVGMPRSGTSLMEQIIASHPQAKGAGELTYWSAVVSEHEDAIRRSRLDASTVAKIADNYLQLLQERAGDAKHVVDKAPVNADYIGLIHAVFPEARFVYMQRDPVDTCLSCFFQKFAHLNFTMDLSDLAKYYVEHERLMSHWRSVLPPTALLEVPYEALVADQKGWTRKVIDFIRLEWDERCLEFYNTKRAVVTSSFWQVRQGMYKKSVARWHNYKPFIDPLLRLRKASSH